MSIELQEDLDALNVLINEITPERLVDSRQELWELVRAFEVLPISCREVLWMDRVENLTQKQIAERLSLTVRAVEKRIATGIRLLRETYLLNMQSSNETLSLASMRGQPEHG